MKLHILTACTRPENLPVIEAAMHGADAHGVDIIWHMRRDMEHQHVGGQALKNQMLDEIDPKAADWVWICDDDNTIHPAFFERLAGTIATHKRARLIVIAQQHRTGYVRRVSRSMLKQTHVDAGQVVIRRDAIGDARIPLHYCGDGEWIEGLATTLADDQIAYITDPVCYYNWLRDA